MDGFYSTFYKSAAELAQKSLRPGKLSVKEPMKIKEIGESKAISRVRNHWTFCEKDYYRFTDEGIGLFWE
jgi:hypothetical protein